MKRLLSFLLVLLCTSGVVFGVCPFADLTGDCKVDMEDFAVMASEWLTEGVPDPEGIIWVDINDPGVSGHEGFAGYMSKYEMTNAQYREFLNSALASGDVIVDGTYVKGADGSNSGADFVGQVYYDLAGPGITANGATNGGAARIHFFNFGSGYFFVDISFDNYPATYVSWYGATAFCNYYGYRLPTEWEWQAVADYTGSYLYGCGTSINFTIANYAEAYTNSVHPNGTTCVGAFGTYGYGLCDMAGNAFEWTSSIYTRPTRVLRGGHWRSDDTFCMVTHRGYYDPSDLYYHIGFRPVLDLN